MFTNGFYYCDSYFDYLHLVTFSYLRSFLCFIYFFFLMELPGLTWVHILTVYIYYFNVDALLPSVFFWASHLLSIPLSCLLIWLGMTFLLNTCVLTSHNTIDLWQLVWCSSNFAFLPLSLSVIYVTCFFHINAVRETSHGIPSSCSQFHVEPSFFCCDLCYLDSQDGFVFLLEEV